MVKTSLSGCPGLDPRAGQALQIAALAGDIDRADS